MHRLILLLAFPLFLPVLLPGQPPATKEAFRKNYQRRIQKEYLNGVYIPKDVPDAFMQFNQLIDKESKQKFRKVNENTAVTKLHFSLGRWIILNWGFYEGSRLSHYLRTNLEIYHPEDMARFLILTYHRNLNGESLNVKELVEEIQQKQEVQRQQLLEQGTIIHEETRKRNAERGGE